jgi:hypothetical protein
MKRRALLKRAALQTDFLVHPPFGSFTDRSEY